MSVEELEKRLDRYRFSLSESDMDLLTQEKTIDLLECISLLVSKLSKEERIFGCKSVEDRIEQIFKSELNDFKVLTLTTIHKAKGLEWDRVYLLQPGDMPMRWVMTKGEHWERMQEMNCV